MKLGAVTLSVIAIGLQPLVASASTTRLRSFFPANDGKPFETIFGVGGQDYSNWHMQGNTVRNLASFTRQWNLSLATTDVFSGQPVSAISIAAHCSVAGGSAQAIVYDGNANITYAGPFVACTGGLANLTTGPGTSAGSLPLLGIHNVNVEFSLTQGGSAVGALYSMVTNP